MYTSESPAPADHRIFPVRLGVSACLLGRNVRYDGGHKLDHHLIEALGALVDWVPVCPEAETGLGIPREAMWLIGTGNQPRLITRRTHIDHTARMQTWAAGRIRELVATGIRGFICKGRSPSCGMRDVAIRGEDGLPDSMGAGIWARAFMDANPDLPVADEERLRDGALLEEFIQQISAGHRQRP